MTKLSSDMVELSIPCHPRYLSVARLLVARIGAQTGLTIDEVDDMKVAVSEAITNVIDHAYVGEDQADIIVRFKPGEGELIVEVEDSGTGFEPDKLEERSLPDPAAGGGLGLYLVREMADQVQVASAPGSGTKITITKRRHG